MGTVVRQCRKCRKEPSPYRESSHLVAGARRWRLGEGLEASPSVKSIFTRPKSQYDGVVGFRVSEK